MIQIDAVEIKYFRSIYRLRIKDLTDVTVLAGRNDIGKSNILKALNLFFNNQTDWQAPLEFARDFNRQRLGEVRRETIKGRQFIEVTVKFVRGARSEKSLPTSFQVTRTWYRDSANPELRDSISRQFNRGEVETRNEDRARASLQGYLGSIRFEYVPAVKERSFFAYLLGRLQDVIFEQSSGQSETASAVQRLNTSVEREAQQLHEEFGRATGVPIRLHLPAELGDLFRAFAVATRQGDEELPLDVRGDGIRARFLPSLLHYVSQHSSLHYVWGFEEPENSIEHGLATKLAAEMNSSYCREAQIFLTTHSPAFLLAAESTAQVFRVSQGSDGTAATRLAAGGTDGDEPAVLHTDLGLLELQRQFQRDFTKRLASFEVARKTASNLRRQIRELRRPVLLVEGKWDGALLTEAWRRLNPSVDCPLAILPCSTLPSQEEAGGVGALKIALESVRPDEPITIGLFDRDKEGAERGFGNLAAVFSSRSNKPDVKYQRAGAAAAVLLPMVAGREEHARALNLVLEFYFADKYLRRKVGGRGLSLVVPEVERVVVGTGLKLGRSRATEGHLKGIDRASKKVFATEVVPSLPDDAFSSFKGLFRLVLEVLADVRAMRPSRSGAHRPRPRNP